MKKLFLTTIFFFIAISTTFAQKFTGIFQENDEFAGSRFEIRVPKLPDKLDFAGEVVPINRPDVKRAVQREVLTTSNMHTATTLSLIRSSRWIPIIKPILKSYGIPEDFIYLCFAESGMNPEAISTAKAAGLWQIMAGTAKDYGLETGSNVDLRYNVELATEAACKILKKSYDSLGNWTLAAASYNIGLGGIRRRLKIQQVDDYWDLNLPEETMRYVSRILSFKLLLENPSKYGFFIDDEDYFPPFENFILLTLQDTEIDWCALAKRYGTNYKMLRILNPWIRSYSYENKGRHSYIVKIPTKLFKEKGY